MALSNDRVPILIVGATGDLGSALTRHSLANPKLLVNIFVRDPTKVKDVTAEVEANGGKVFIGDLDATEVLNEATKNVHTVIFVVPVASEQLHQNQLSLIDISVKNGVKRFIPSEFGIDTTRLPKDLLEKILPLLYKQKAKDYLKTQPITATHFYNGAFATYFMPIFGDFKYYGDSSRKVDVIAFDDLAKLVATAVGHEDLSGDVFFTGNRFTIEEAAKIYNKVKGTNVEAKREGSIEDLYALFENKNKTGFSIEGLLIGLKYLVLSGSQEHDEFGNEKFQKFTQTAVEDVFRKFN